MPRKFVTPSHPKAMIVSQQAEIGLMVRAARTRQQIRIDDAAAMSKVSVALLSALESGGTRGVKIDNLLKVIDQFGLALIITDKDQAKTMLSAVNG